MKVFLSPLAEKKIQFLLEYLEQEWSIKSREIFITKLLKKLDQISRQPNSCINSKEYPNLYKCIVTKQTSLFYRINSDEIEVITLIDNRQDPEKIEIEIRKHFVIK
jgi:plasmid stabilization system protein ParE